MKRVEPEQGNQKGLTFDDKKKAKRKKGWNSYIQRIAEDAKKQRKKKEMEMKLSQSNIDPKAASSNPMKPSDTSDKDNSKIYTKITTGISEIAAASRLSNTLSSNTNNRYYEHEHETQINSLNESETSVNTKSNIPNTMNFIRDKHSNYEQNTSNYHGQREKQDTSNVRRYEAIFRKLETIEKRNKELQQNEIRLKNMNRNLISELSFFRDQDKNKSISKPGTGANSNEIHDSVAFENLPSFVKYRMREMETVRNHKLNNLVLEYWKLYTKREVYRKLIIQRKCLRLKSLFLRNWGCFVMLEKLNKVGKTRRTQETALMCIRKWEEYLWIRNDKAKKKEKAMKFRYLTLWIKYVNNSYCEKRQLNLITDSETLTSKESFDNKENKCTVIVPSVIQKSYEQKHIERYLNFWKSILISSLVRENVSLKEKVNLYSKYNHWKHLLWEKQQLLKIEHDTLKTKYKLQERKLSKLVYLNRWKNSFFETRRRLIAEKELAICSVENIYRQVTK